MWPLGSATSRLKSFISQFWQFKLVNVVVLVTTNRSITIFGYNPYLEYSCNLPKIIEIDRCNIRQGSFVNSNNLFPLAETLTNLNKCKLYCFVKNRPPDSLVRRKEDETWELDGVGGKLMEIVQKRINFTAVIQTPELTVTADKYGYDISRGFPELVANLLNNLTVDFAFGIYSHIIYDNPTTEFAASAVSECYGWAVPAHSG